MILSSTGCRIIFGVALGAMLAAPGWPQAAHKPTAPPKSVADEQSYRNATFGFRYKIPFGWVNRTKEMQEQPPQAETQAEASDPNTSSSNPKAPKHKQAGSSEVLLAVFERPPEAAGDSVNSAVVIASESAASYPGFKTVDDYLEPLTELATSKGFKANGEPSGLTIDGREFVRADFTKALTDKLTMYQTTLAMLAKGRIVSFTMIAGSEDEIDELIENVGFSGSRAR
jgi:hypothetical protein